MGISNVLYVTASLLETLVFLFVGISFFGPFWLSNIPHSYQKELNFNGNKTYINGITNATIYIYPERGLWAQCGLQCRWFWNDDYLLQRNMLTPLKWHLATQILYFIAATIILAAEIYARVQQCCCKLRRFRIYLSLGIMLLVSALLQTAAVATFGGGASRNPYNAISDPKKFTSYLGQAFRIWNDPNNLTYVDPYLGWCYWMAVVGDMLSIVVGVLYLVAACCRRDDSK